MNILNALRFYVGKRILVNSPTLGGDLRLAPPPDSEILAVKKRLEALWRMVELPR